MDDINEYAAASRRIADAFTARVKEAVAVEVGDVNFDIVEWAMGWGGEMPPSILLFYRALTVEGVEQSGVIPCQWHSEEPEWKAELT